MLVGDIEGVPHIMCAVAMSIDYVGGGILFYGRMRDHEHGLWNLGCVVQSGSQIPHPEPFPILH